MLVHNRDTVDIRVTLDALLQPFTALPDGSTSKDNIRIARTSEGAQSIPGHVLSERLKAGSSEKMQVYLSATEVPGLRNVDLSFTCKPLASAIEGETASDTDVEARIATTELSKRLQIEAVHPFFCDFGAEWSRMPISAQAPGLLDMEQPDPWIGSIKLLLDITTGGLGPAEVTVQKIKLNLAVSRCQVFRLLRKLIMNGALAKSDGCRMLSSSIEPDDEQLPDSESGTPQSAGGCILILLQPGNQKIPSR